METAEETRALFDKACKYVASVAGSLSTNDQLYFYARYKTVTEGPCNTSKPSFFQMKECQKWNAWKSVEGLAREDAIEQYIDRLNVLHPDWHKETGARKGAVFVSTMMNSAEEDAEGDFSNMCLKAIVQDDEEAFREEFYQRKDEMLNWRDDQGLTLLHWACDRQRMMICQYLLDNNADVNATDEEGDSSLHYASSCGYSQVAQLLLQHGGDLALKNKDGETPLDVAESEEMKQNLLRVHGN